MKTHEAFRVVIIDDDAEESLFLKKFLEKRCGEEIRIELYNDPREAVPHLKPNISILILDWRMPHLDGKEVLEEARQRGVNPKRIIILSGFPAENLHENFSLDKRLAVIEKGHLQQEGIFLNIIDEIIALDRKAFES